MFSRKKHSMNISKQGLLKNIKKVFTQNISLQNLKSFHKMDTASTRKHRTFVSEPIGHKSIDHLPGIGKALSKKLEEKQFHKAFQVLGQFLILNMDKESFCKWLEEQTGANTKYCNMCYEGLKEWSTEYIL